MAELNNFMPLKMNGFKTDDPSLQKYNVWLKKCYELNWGFCMWETWYWRSDDVLMKALSSAWTLGRSSTTHFQLATLLLLLPVVECLRLNSLWRNSGGVWGMRWHFHVGGVRGMRMSQHTEVGGLWGMGMGLWIVVRLLAWACWVGTTRMPFLVR